MADHTRTIKRVLTLVVAMAVGLVTWVFVQFRHLPPPSPPPLPDASTQSIMTLSKVHHTATKDGVIQWKLEAHSAELESGSNTMVLQNPLIDFYFDDGSRMNLRAQKGRLDTITNDIKVDGNVLLFNDRYTFKTETLTYQHQKRLLQSDTPVDIVTPSFNLKAATMIYDLNDEQATFHGNIRGKIHEKPAS